VQTLETWAIFRVGKKREISWFRKFSESLTSSAWRETDCLTHVFVEYTSTIECVAKTNVNSHGESGIEISKKGSKVVVVVLLDAF
jgi:hypothetical protein